jgi:hypothetical protein
MGMQGLLQGKIVTKKIPTQTVNTSTVQSFSEDQLSSSHARDKGPIQLSLQL